MDTVLTITPTKITEKPSHEKTVTIGKKVFGEKIDITDPCYHRNVWCRLNDVKIVPGEYECYIEILDNEATGGFGERVSCIGIRNTAYTVDPYTLVYEHLDSIGVDSGLAGFFNNKQDYTDSEWHDLCKCFDTMEQAWIRDDGFFSRSGNGDGDYDVFAARKGGRIVALFIEFIDSDCDDGGEC